VARFVYRHTAWAPGWFTFIVWVLAFFVLVPFGYWAGANGTSAILAGSSRGGGITGAIGTGLGWLLCGLFMLDDEWKPP
jgi:hypothetical protein